jgi:hypothetical protein
MVHSNDYSLRVESVRENRIEAVRIRDHASDTRRSSNGGSSSLTDGDAPAESVRDRG